jgi:hypothetical protein
VRCGTKNIVKEDIMKKIVLVLLTIVTVVGGMTAGAYADDTVNLDISAVVADTCSAITNGTAVNLALDPSAGGDITNGVVLSADPSIYCTKGSSHAVSCTPSNGALTIGNDGSTDPIPYSINGCTSPLTGQGFTTATTIPFGIDILGANYQDAQAGVHTDTVVITVTY